MTGTAHAGLGYLALTFTASVLFIRWAFTGGQPPKHRAARLSRIEVEVPGHVLIPALAYGAAVPTAIRPCPPCGRPVPVVVHGTAHRCDAGHLTIHTTTGVTSR